VLNADEVDSLWKVTMFSKASDTLSVVYCKGEATFIAALVCNTDILMRLVAVEIASGVPVIVTLAQLLPCGGREMSIAVPVVAIKSFTLQPFLPIREGTEKDGTFNSNDTLLAMVTSL
jgi:hypothetical protein